MLRLDPNHYWAHNNLALLLVKKGQIREAISHLQAAVRIDPNAQAARHNLSVYKGGVGE